MKSRKKEKTSFHGSITTTKPCVYPNDRKSARSYNSFSKLFFIFSFPPPSFSLKSLLWELARFLFYGLLRQTHATLSRVEGNDLINTCCLCVCLIFIPRHLIGQQCVATLTHNFFKLLFLASLKCVKLHLSCLKKGYQKLSKDKKIRSPPGATTEISKMSSHIFPPKRRKKQIKTGRKKSLYDTDLSSLLISKWNGWPWNIKVERQQLQIPFRRDGSTWLLLHIHTHTHGKLHLRDESRSNN